MQGKISVIVPALNEERTIGPTVAECLKAASVLEVIVVDDKSTDRTAEKAMAAGARLVTSEIRGKGKSMEDGLASARGGIIVFVDADIKNFSHLMVDLITAPILKGESDFVKSSYGRKSGRVTELVAKPLLSVLFPALVDFKQPLSGIIAGKASFFSKMRFENDYGVDIGILIDMVNLGARVSEVDIGYISHKMKPWRKLTGMSTEVAHSILKRARMTNMTIQEGLIAEASIIKGMLLRGTEVAFPIGKAAFLDIDGTVLRDRFIFSFAGKNMFGEPLARISSSAMESYGKTRAIASLMKGFFREEVESFASKMPLSGGIDGLMRGLKDAGYFTVLISDGYETVAQKTADRIGADAVIANRLGFDDERCDGSVEVNPLFLPSSLSCARHAVCKLTAAMKFCRLHDVPFEKTFAIGNSRNDACLLRFANVSYAFMPEDETTASSAKYAVWDLSEVKAL